ncbi:transposase family protein [Streptomyces sp. NPDC001250]|uniref:transposase family protein n=1 Tax=unclassified Streptomyces TaxID=2593676 RepID=UPI003320AB05
MKAQRHAPTAAGWLRQNQHSTWPGRSRTHHLTAARAHGIVEACPTRQILILADRAYQGTGATVRTPYYHHEQPEQYQQFSRDHARLRAPGERALARLRSWRLLHRARCSTRRIGTAVQAVHTLMTCTYSGRKAFSGLLNLLKSS